MAAAKSTSRFNSQWKKMYQITRSDSGGWCSDDPDVDA
jgi:hypothetical protein